jgi:hypothetical protein
VFSYVLNAMFHFCGSLTLVGVTQFIKSVDARGYVVVSVGHWKNLIHESDLLEVPVPSVEGNTMISLGAYGQVVVRGYTTDLHRAAKGDAKAIPLILAAGSDINERDEHGATPIHIASRHNADALEALLKDGRADMSLMNGDGWNPMHIAANYNFYAIRHLIEAGGDINEIGFFGYTPLHIASQCNPSAIETILKFGASTTVLDDSGSTALAMAAAFNPSSIGVFLDAGAVVDRKSLSHMCVRREIRLRMVPLLSPVDKAAMIVAEEMALKSAEDLLGELELEMKNQKQKQQKNKAKKKQKKTKKQVPSSPEANEANEANDPSSSTSSSSPSSSSPSSSSLYDDDDDDCLCVVCMDAPSAVCCSPCGHVCLCVDCAPGVSSKWRECPMCRMPVFGA